MTTADGLEALIESVVRDHPGDGDSGGLPPVWPTMAGLGLAAVGVPEAAGGSGGTVTDVAVIVREMARFGIGSPLLEATVANWVCAGDGPVSAKLPVVVVPESGAEIRPDASPLTMSGRLAGVPWGRHSDRLVVVAVDGAFMIDPRGPGVQIERRTNLAGEARDTVILQASPARPIAQAPDAAQVRARLGLLWSAALYGASAGAYEMTRRHVRQREQFGRPLVALTAVATSLAVMKVDVLQAGAAVLSALDRWPCASSHELTDIVAVARIATAQAATEIAQLAHQLHGALGITREYSLHPLTRRLWAWRDADRAEHEWAASLGRSLCEIGEARMWDELADDPRPT